MRARLLLDWFASVGITDLRVQVHGDCAAVYWAAPWFSDSC